MADTYVLGIDQSTQGTKALLFDGYGRMIRRSDVPHRQIVNDKGWVEHDAAEILGNVYLAVRKLLDDPADAARIGAVGICNQRETVAAWDRRTGEPVGNAIVWQCARGSEICREAGVQEAARLIRERTGLTLSPYFSAAKMSWILKHREAARKLAEQGYLCLGTMDSFLIWHLTEERHFYTDYSNASRTQLYNIMTLQWDDEIGRIFGVGSECLPEVHGSDEVFGLTDLGGILPKAVPLCGVIGDSQGALFGQGCHLPGMVKATYGTGSSIMLNIGNTPLISEAGIVTSLAWGIENKVQYVLEGNVNNAGAVITWLQNVLGLISSPADCEEMARQALGQDRTYLVPAFTGLGAPYWDSEAQGLISGITRTTGPNEIVRAALDSIAYQISDIVFLMEREAGCGLKELRVDGGPTANGYLMQFQSDLTGLPVRVPQEEELSGIGAAYLAGISSGIYRQETLFSNPARAVYRPQMSTEIRAGKLDGWKEAVGRVLYRG